MTKEQQRIDLAEWMFKELGKVKSKDGRLVFWSESLGRHTSEIANYPEDLNALREVLLKLSPAELIRYTEILCAEIQLVDWGYYPGEAGIDWSEVSKLTTVGANQCCESVCKTLWPEKFNS